MEEKSNLEVEKLQLEVAQLKNRWWTKPAYLGLLLPMVLAGLSFLTAYSTGYFDRERARLEREKELLEKEIASLNKGVNDLAENKQALEVQIRRIRIANDRLTESIEKIVESRSTSGPAEAAQRRLALSEYRDAYLGLMYVIAKTPSTELTNE